MPWPGPMLLGPPTELPESKPITRSLARLNLGYRFWFELHADHWQNLKGVRNSLRIAWGLEIVFGFLSWYHLSCICNSLELKPIILHDICYIVACSPSLLHGICYISGTSTSHVYGICYMLVLQTFKTSHFAWYVLNVGTSNVHAGFSRVSFWVSLGFL